MLIGEVLVRANVITPEDLVRALALQPVRSERLGPLLVLMNLASQERIDAAWAEAIVTPPFIEALNYASKDAFGHCFMPSVDYLQITRRHTTIEDMRRGASLQSTHTIFEVIAHLQIDQARSPEIDFTLDATTGAVSFSPCSAIIARRWIDLVRRGVAAGSRKIAPPPHATTDPLEYPEQAA